MPSPLRTLDVWEPDPITKKPRRVKKAAYTRHQGKRERLRRLLRVVKEKLKQAQKEMQ